MKNICKMAEKNLIVDGLEMHYKGIFDLKELLDEINNHIAGRGYQKAEKRRQENVTSSGKTLNIELRPTKAKTEYCTFMIKIRINITNLKQVKIMRNKIKENMDNGNITMIFDAWMITDYKFRWEQKAYFYFYGRRQS